MKEKRYEIVKRKDRVLGINALSAPENSVNGDILENESRYHTGSPRSSLINTQYNEVMTKKYKGKEALSAKEKKKK